MNLNYKLVSAIGRSAKGGKTNKSRLGVASGGALVSTLLGVFLLLALIPSAAFAQGSYKLTNNLDIVTNWPGSSYNQQRVHIQNDARWWLYGDPPTNISGYGWVSPSDFPDWVNINYLTMTNYYVPDPLGADIYLACDTNITYDYIPYSNTLALTIAGTNGMTSNVVWSFSESSVELGNSTAYKGFYTNNCDLTPVPTGKYTVAFPTVSGFTTASAWTNITWDSPQTNSITGTYARVYGTITVTVSPTNGSWSFTPPSDFASFSSSALSGTNSATLTNMPVGVYTIHYGAIAGYVPPSDDTKTSTTINTNLAFNGPYSLGSSSLKVQFMPIAAQSPARWWVYDNFPVFIDYGPFIHNYTKSLTSSNNYTGKH